MSGGGRGTRREYKNGTLCLSRLLQNGGCCSVVQAFHEPQKKERLVPFRMVGWLTLLFWLTGKSTYGVRAGFFSGTAARVASRIKK